MTIKKVDNLTASEIIATREIGRFYTVENIRGQDVYVGIDNRDGDAWTEEFNDLADCIGWLKE